MLKTQLEMDIDFHHAAAPAPPGRLFSPIFFGLEFSVSLCPIILDPAFNLFPIQLQTLFLFIPGTDRQGESACRIPELCNTAV